MNNISTQHIYRVDLDSSPVVAALELPVSLTDALADEILLRVRRGNEAADLTGMQVLAYLTNAATQTLPIAGTAEGGTVTVILPAEAYAVPGRFHLAVQVTDGDVRHTLLHLQGEITRTTADELISAGELLPSLPELLERIAHMQQATQEAIAASETCLETTDYMASRADAAIADLAAQTNLAAPAIHCEVTGATAQCGDAAERPAVHIISAISAVQEGSGDPSSENVRPITGHDNALLYHALTLTDDLTPAFTTALPETVHGGTLDWATGTLTITHRLIALDSNGASEAGVGSGVWVSGSNNFYLELTDRAETTTLQSNRFVTSTRVATQLYEGQMCLSQTYPRVVFANPGNELSLDEWKAQCDETPIQLLYELATPRVIQLSPCTLSLLAGQNALRSSTGDTSLVYIADTKAYIDNRLAAIAANIQGE